MPSRRTREWLWVGVYRGVDENASKVVVDWECLCVKVVDGCRLPGLYSDPTSPLNLLLKGKAVGSALLFIFLACMYFLPWIVSLSRKHNNSGAIAVLNLLLGWTIAGWIAAMIWSMTDNVKRERDATYYNPMTGRSE